MSFHFYCTRYSIAIILALGLAGTAAEAQTATRGFESSTADTWAYTPNPAADAAAVRLSRPVAGTLLDALDHTVYQLPTATDCLDVRGLPAGLYLLRATDGATSRLLVRQTNRIVAQNFPLVLC